MKTYTCIATCKRCGQELNRATGVPEDRRLQTILAAPMVSICPVVEHNTYPDCNIGVRLEWVEEVASV